MTASSSTVSGVLVTSLDGEWQSARDLSDGGIAAKWYDPAHFPAGDARPSLVPGTVTETWPIASWWSDAPTNIIWYLKTFRLEAAPQAHTRVYLRFGAVKQTSTVWLNGVMLGTHAGGEDPFEFDVGALLAPGASNTVAVRLKTALLGGITQHVTLVAQPEVRILDVFARPDARAGLVRLEVTMENDSGAAARVALEATLGEFKGRREVASQAVSAEAPAGRTVVQMILPVARPHRWDLGDPFLYTVAVASDWRPARADLPLRDSYRFRTGFRDFRMVNGYFTLNGRRIFLKSLHGNLYDPLSLQGTPRDMTYLSRDFPELKEAGFNTMRFIMSAALPEQLDEADEMGFLIFSEHETSWMTDDPAKFGITLNPVVRRDRNHPSLVLWGLLNETANLAVYRRARDWLPSLRALDDTRPVLLSSGRWDGDGRTASISNSGSPGWDVYMGGEDPVSPALTGRLRDEAAAYHEGMGDVHVYPFYPLSPGFIADFGALNRAGAHPLFLSECGMGSSYDPMEERRDLLKAHAPATSPSWSWANAGTDGMSRTWAAYHLGGTYPSMEDMLVDSALEASRQRELIFTLVRANPAINGYSLTSLEDFFGAGEGVMNNFREFKPGHLRALQAGWAPLRWCLLVEPTHAYADQPIHIKVSLANEDVLEGGEYAATLTLSGPAGLVWKRPTIAHVIPGGPLAYTLFDGDTRVPGLAAGSYTLEATLSGRPNAAAGSVGFVVTGRPSLPAISGPVSVVGVAPDLRALLAGQGADVRNYAPGHGVDRETLLVGPDFKGDATRWRALYRRAAQGAHIVFLSDTVFLTDKHHFTWLALASKGERSRGRDWLYHKDVIGRTGDPLLAGLQSRLMTPEYYGALLEDTRCFRGITLPTTVAAVAVYSSLTDKYSFYDGVMLGTYPFHAGHFTINAFNIVGSIGSPATDRLLVNLVTQAQADASPLVPLPGDFDAEMDALGITEPPLQKTVN